MSYKYRTKPFVYQAKVFRETANRAAFGLLYEQGLGKSKIIIDTCAYLFQEKKIRGMVVVAPNGVHRNWISDEIPAHMPDDVRETIKYIVWDSKKSDQVGFQKQLKAVMNHDDGLAIILVCYEASITPKCKTLLKRFLDSRPCLMVLDESHKIKSADSKVKTTLVALGGHARFRRIASGTPLERPFDCYPQIRFLDPTFWKNRGFPTYEDFKQHFGIFVERSFGPRSFSQLVGHKNLEELGRYIGEIAERLTKEQAGLNLPAKIYSKRYYELSSEQRRVYNEVKDQMRSTLESGELLEVKSAITKMLRLQQVACGYVSCEAEQPAKPVCKDSPRMDLACEILEDLNHQAIIWHRFKADIDEMCLRLGNRCVRYDGQVGSDDRAFHKQQFQKGDVQFFVASKAASTGLTLVGAKTGLYYSNSFSYIDRVQSEDRCVLAGTPVLTPDGWTPIQDIQKGQLVIGHSGKPCLVTDTWSKQCVKNLVSVHVKGWQEPLTTTFDHLWLMQSGEWKKADDLRPGDLIAGAATSVEEESVKRLPFPAELRLEALGLDADNGMAVGAPEHLTLDEETLFVLGYFAGDGFSSTLPGKGRFLSFSGNTTTKWESMLRIQKWFRALGITCTIYDRQDTTGREMRAYCAELTFWFEEMFSKGAHNKKLPWLQNLTQQECKWLLAGLARSDGYWRMGRLEYVTMSDTLAGQVHLLMSRCGFKPCLTKQTCGAHVVSYTESHPKGNKVTKIEISCPNRVDGKRLIVHDLTVKDDESFIIGPCVVHNCHRIGQTVGVNYIDMIANDTIDEYIVKALRKKQDVVTLVLQDEIKPWI